MVLIENIIYELSRVSRKITEVEVEVAKTTSNLTQVNTLIQAENILIRCIGQLTDLDVVPVKVLDEVKDDNDALKQLILGEWVDCDVVQKALGIDFATGMKMFEFSRTSEWNSRPLNGQRAVTKFRLRGGSNG